MVETPVVTAHSTVGGRWEHLHCTWHGDTDGRSTDNLVLLEEVEEVRRIELEKRN